MHYRRVLMCLAGIALLAMATSWCSIAAAETTTTTKTTSVAAFKNGLGFFVREGEAVLTDGWAVSEVVPSAALGTFWVGSPKPGVSIERLTALQEEVTRILPAVSVQEMLAANVGKKVRIMIRERLFEGKVVAVPEDRKPDPDRPTYPVFTSLVPSAKSQLALIETKTGMVAINKNSISWVEFDGPANVSHTAKEKVKRFRFKVAGATDKAPVTIGYLQKGISWSPAYLIDLLDEKKARITMQGLLVNDVEDIEGADVCFVVGYPNFVFADTLSPLALTQSLTEFVERLGRPSRSRSAYGGIATQSVAGFALYDMAPVEETPGFGYSGTTETPGVHEEDLFLYQMKDVSLRKGERAYYTVFSAEVPYAHVYEWIVPDTSGIQASGRLGTSRQSEQVPIEDQVWHKLKLTNSSKFPWTTAPAMAMSNGQALSQDTLTYTPREAKGNLKVTIATDIRGKKSEQEKSRETEALRAHGYVFAKVTADGKLTLKNFKSKAVTVTVKKAITGEVVSAGHNGRIEKSAEGIKAVNPTSVITWEVPLAAGEEKTLDYTYFVYVRY